MKQRRLFLCVVAVFAILLPSRPMAADWQTEWEKTLAAARKEGVVVAGIPASAELRKAIASRFKDRFGIALELFPARGPENVTRIINESNAGVRYFDVLVAGGATPLAMVAAQAADPFEPYMILPEVRDAKNWWGGHIWEDNVGAKRQIYAFQCYTSETFWHNTSQVASGEIRSYDDLLHPQWKGKIGFLDPRSPGSGQNSWTFLWKVKGEEYLQKLVEQDLMINTNLRQIADSLAKGKLVFTIGLSHYSYEPFLKAGLPVGPIRKIREGAHANNGSGVVAVVKNPPHPNAVKVFVNWLLGKEGQETYGRAMIQGTRRLDVDNDWLKDYGIEACKNVMTVEDYYRLETHLESSVQKLRTPAVALAKKLLK
jgi:iron(III) transport system substrate-binding protein